MNESKVEKENYRQKGVGSNLEDNGLFSLNPGRQADEVLFGVLFRLILQVKEIVQDFSQ